MLATRIATAAVLLAILLPAIFLFPPIAWGLVSLVFLAVGAHEWVSLLGERRHAWRAAGLMVLAGLLLLAWRRQHDWPAGLVLAGSLALTLFWCLGGAWRLRRTNARVGGWPLALTLLFGCWAAMYELRVLGVMPLLSSMAVVWVADVAAYFVGRAIGRRKLAPTISPGKSWEGAIGGFVFVALSGALAANWPALASSLPSRLAAGLPWLIAMLLLVALAMLSIVGDLHESLLKRQAGVKDSGTLLPGHGGVLDRIDALVPVMPAALLLYEVVRG
jgi:phosphatidate cytidylyltransferase